MEMSGQLYAPAALSPGKYVPAPIAQKAGWHQNSSGRYGVLVIAVHEGLQTTRIRIASSKTNLIMNCMSGSAWHLLL
jgi:hypothetical protein